MTQIKFLCALILLVAGCTPAAPRHVIGTPISQSGAARATPSAARPVTGGDTRPAAASLHDVDFLNRTYDGVAYACDGGTCAFTLRDGTAPVLGDGGERLGDVDVCRVDIGAFGETSEPLALVSLCLSGGGLLGNRASAVPYHFVYRLGADGEPQLVARADEEVAAATAIDGVRSGVRADGDRLVLAGAVYGRNDATCCPSAAGEQTLTVAGGTLRPTGSLRSWPIGQAPPDPSQTDAWDVLLDRAGPFEYGAPLPARYRTANASAACHEVRPEGAPYGLTLIVENGVVQGARMVGPNWQTRSDVGVGTWPPSVRDTYGARITDGRFGPDRGMLYSPSSGNPNRIGFVVRDERIVSLLGGRAGVVGRGGVCGERDATPTPAPRPAAGIRTVDFSRFTYSGYPLCDASNGFADYLPCRSGSITFADSAASNPASRFGNGNVALLDVVYKDLDGDGQDDALVTHGYDIFLGNGSIQGVLVLVYSGTAARTRRLASLAFADIRDELGEASGQPALWYPGMRVLSDGTVEVKALAGIPRAAPPYLVTAIYRYRNGRFRRASQPRVSASEF